MKKDRIVGAAKEIKGSVKDTLSDADAPLTAERRIDKAKLKIQKSAGALKYALRE